MKKIKVIAIVLAAALCMGLLSGCGSFSATELVKNNLDLIYLNQYTDDYLTRVGLDKEQADQEYEDGLAVEAEYFASTFSIELDICGDEIRQQIIDLYRQIYTHSKYEVGAESRSGDTYLVQLTVYPIDIFQKVNDEDAEAFLADMQERADAGEFVNMTDDEYEVVWAQAIIDMVSARIDSIGYLDPQTISVQVVKGDDNVYSIDDSDFNRIDSLIISY
mgnify:CR=1 FL=1